MTTKKDKPAQGGTGSKKTEKVKTPIKQVKATPAKEETLPLRKGDAFLFIKDGNPVYYTRSTANVLFTRNVSNVEIPKGSDYVPPKGSKCKGCE